MRKDAVRATRKVADMMLSIVWAFLGLPRWEVEGRVGLRLRFS